MRAATHATKAEASAPDLQDRDYRESLRDLLARHSRRDFPFLQALERALQQALRNRYPDAQILCLPLEAGVYRFDVYIPTAMGYLDLPPAAWRRHLDLRILRAAIAAIPVHPELDSRIFLARGIGSLGRDLLVSADDPMTPDCSAPLAVLPERNFAFLDTPESLAGNPFFASLHAGDVQRGYPVVTRAHSFFLRDLCRFAGIDPLATIINAASGLLITQSRPDADALRWVARQAHLRALHWAPPPLDAGRFPVQAVQAAVRYLTHIRLPRKRIRIDPAGGHPVARIYAPDERGRFVLVGPWAGTIRLLSRYLGMPVRVLPESETPWI